MLNNELTAFFDSQLCEWEQARVGVEQLEAVEQRHFDIDGAAVTLQFNPARIVSTSAKIDRKSLAQRPCFLCRNNRPAQQRALPILQGYELLVNPFPILPQHLTLPLSEHSPQTIVTNYADMMKMAQLLVGHIVFYNGPHCGASAPDHLHFQAGKRGVVPIERDFETVYRPQLRTADCAVPDAQVYMLRGYVVGAYVIVAQTVEASSAAFAEVCRALPVNVGDYEAMMNVIAWADECGGLVSIVFPRRKHRPDCYYAEGDEQMLVSPGALDMGGLVITPRRSDFERMTESKIKSILEEVALI